MLDLFKAKYPSSEESKRMGEKITLMILQKLKSNS